MAKKSQIPDNKKRRWEKISDEDIAEALMNSGGVYLAAVSWLANNKRIYVDRTTIAKRVKASPELQEAKTQATEKMLDVAENRLMGLINEGDKGAICFFLKCRGKDRGYVEKKEIVPTEPLKVQIAPLELKGVSEDKVMDLIIKAFEEDDGDK